MGAARRGDPARRRRARGGHRVRVRAHRLSPWSRRAAPCRVARPGSDPRRPRAEPGFLRALLALSRAAALIGETDEADRCVQFLVDSGTSADEVAALLG
ncbi:DUF3151 family protein [Oerskovia sp. M15]